MFTPSVNGLLAYCWIPSTFRWSTCRTHWRKRPHARMRTWRKRAHHGQRAVAGHHVLPCSSDGRGGGTADSSHHPAGTQQIGKCVEPPTRLREQAGLPHAKIGVCVGRETVSKKNLSKAIKIQVMPTKTAEDKDSLVQRCTAARQR